MADIYKPVDWSIQQLVDAVRTGTLTLPDLQRPFVWPATKVRDLMDSLYRGYPVGELMFWNQPGDAHSGAIGTDAKGHSSKQQIVDGQQRLTSLFVTVTGQTVVDDDYRKKSIRITFNPLIDRFEVAQPAYDRSAEWVGDVSSVFSSALDAYEKYKSRLEKARGVALGDAERSKIHSSLMRVEALKSVIFKVVEIQANVDKAVVADVFVRINSEGVNLTSADFILTWLSVFWPEGRDELETFARNSRLTADHITELTGKKTTWSPKNHYISPSPGQLIRVAVAVGQNRGRLQDAYNALRAQDRKTGMADAKKQSDELELVKTAAPLMLNQLNWDEFIRVLAKAGFRSKKMVTSETTILYTYSLWILGRTRYKVELSTLRDLMARWFFMAQTTGRYTGSPETRIQQDLDRLDGATSADDFARILNGVIETILTPDYWSIRLPDDFVSSSTSASPAYQAYLAALNILDANLFMLHGRVRDWTDPSDTSVRNVEGHHLFPKAYLRDALGYTDIKKINQVANFAPTDWDTNNLISDRPPFEYWPDLIKDRKMDESGLAKQHRWHALPDGWTELEYEEFLVARRKMMATVVRDGYLRLEDPTYQPEITVVPPTADDEHFNTTLLDLLGAGLINPEELITPVESDGSIIAEITDDGQILLNDKSYDTPDRAAKAAGEDIANGWDYWGIPAGDGTVSLRALAKQFADLHGISSDEMQKEVAN
jgi:hypothetical protein